MSSILFSNKRMFNTKVMKLIRPQLVTFDVTGTLLRTRLEHYAEIGAEHGAATCPEKLAPSFKQHWSRLSAEHPVFGKHTGLGWENWWKNMVYSVFRDHNPQISDETLDKVANSLIVLYGTDRCWHKYPGTKDILSYLNDHDVVVGVVSNFDERLEQILVSTGIRHYFSFVLTSYGHGTEKPDIGIFEEALKLGGRVRGTKINPSEALHIGDNYKLDYVGAKNAGWAAYLMQHGSDRQKHDEVTEFEIFKDLEELKAHFKRIL